MDDNGTIYSGSHDEMSAQWESMVCEGSTEKWEGDLKLVEIHAICR